MAQSSKKSDSEISINLSDFSCFYLAIVAFPKNYTDLKHLRHPDKIIFSDAVKPQKTEANNNQDGPKFVAYVAEAFKT